MVILTTMVTWASASYINITIMTSQENFGLLLNLIYIVYYNIFNLNGIKSSVTLYSIYVISIIYTLKGLSWSWYSIYVISIIYTLKGLSWSWYSIYVISIIYTLKGLSWLWSYGSWIYNYICNQCLSPLTLWVQILFRWSILDPTLCDKVCQWLVAGRWFSLDTLVSSTNKTDCYNITEILLKVALNTISHHHLFTLNGKNFFFTVFLCLLNALVHRTHPLTSPTNLGKILVPIYRTQGDSVKHSRQKSSFKRQNTAYHRSRIC
jgi:hypothetical protein